MAMQSPLHSEETLKSTKEAPELLISGPTSSSISSSSPHKTSAQREAEEKDCMVRWQEQWELRKQIYKEFIYQNTGAGKYTFISWALKTGVPDKATVDSHVDDVRKRNKDVDMHIISLVRLLYLMREREDTGNAMTSVDKATAAATCEDISNALSTFPFWPSKDQEKEDNDHLCFWSENHIVMSLGSAHLTRQYIRQKKSNQANTENSKSTISPISGTADTDSESAALEDALLLSYLQAHASSEIMFEVLSHVYIPYTVSALLNLIDFSTSAPIVEAARGWISVAIRHVLLGTTDTGVATLTASGRAFERTRLYTHGHNINQLVHLLTGTSCEPKGSAGTVEPRMSQVVDFLLTTKYIPLNTDLACHLSQGRITLKGSPSIDEVRGLFPTITEGERIPFYWSAGLLLHPDFTRETKEYQRRKKLNQNDTLWAFSWFPDFAAARLVKAYGPLSRGQSYCGFTLNIFKRHGGLCLSSFERWNVGNCAFQQLPWCANIGGAGVWTQTGNGKDTIGKAFTNTFNPCIRQVGSLCMINHNRDSGMSYGPITSWIMDYTARLFWPDHLFESSSLYTRRYNGANSKYAKHAQSWLQFPQSMQDSNVPCWRIARRGVCFIGVYCTHATNAEPLTQNLPGNALGNTYRTIACLSRNHTWIVLVGTEDQYYDAIGEDQGEAKEKESVVSATATAAATSSESGCLEAETSEQLDSMASVGAEPTRADYSFLNFTQRCLSMSIVDTAEFDGEVVVTDEREGKLCLRADPE